MTKKEKKKGNTGKIIKTVLSGLLSIVLVLLLIFANVLMPSFSKMANSFFGYNQPIDNSEIKAKGLDLDYNVSDYTKEEIKTAEKKLDKQIANEGIVLLKNDKKAMPFKKGTTFSFFSTNSTKYGTSIFGGSELTESFKKEGFQVNKDLWEFYSKGKGSKYGLGKGSISFGDSEDFSINETPLSVLKEEKNLLSSAKDTTPVFVLQRVAGEGRDMPRSMYNHTDIEKDKTKSYLEPDSVELETLTYLNDHYDDVVLVINSNAALDLNWMEEFPNIHSVVYAQASRSDALAGVFSGKVNPSGRTVDTFARNPLESPAAKNFGDYQYYGEDGKETIYNYISYAEGIYVGYKYYETRYEDKVLAQGNPGTFTYQDEVVYPFGYGLSYTDFSWSNYKVTQKDATFKVTVDVKNVGDVAGKDVVELFAQSPYTEYDKANHVEKAAVDLVGYGKTKQLKPGESQTLTINFDQEQLKSYDYQQAQTYILDAGDYYITAAKNANDATNNILTAKGKTVKDGLTAKGNDQLTYKYTPSNSDVDHDTYAKDSYTNKEVNNLFADAHGDITYLSRNDWEGTFPKSDGEPSKKISTWGNEINGKDKNGKPASYTWYKEADKDIMSALKSTDSFNPTDPKTLKDKIVYGKDNGLSLIDLRGLEFDDPLWNKLLDQLTPEEYKTTIIDSGYGTEPLKSINKPFNVDADTASGLIYGGTLTLFPSPMVLAQTWNEELALDFGTMIGNEANLGGADGWYAPAMNIHRTPFSGRNGEYYSEDGFLSGSIAAKEVYGAASKGMYTYIKHFALNDQENHRGDREGQYGLATWSNEQAIREIYLKPFEMSMKVGDVDLNYVKKTGKNSYENATTKIPASQAVMTAFNRIGATWTGGSYPLMTSLLRDEWGFNGFIITDNANTGVFMDPYQMIESGADAKLCNAKDPTNFKFEEQNVSHYHYGRQAMHRILYTVVNSKAMNGAMSGSVFKQGIQFTTKVRLGINIVSIALLLLMGWFTYKRFKKKPVVSETREEKE